MLEGEDERRGWQRRGGSERRSDNRAQNKGWYIILYIYMNENTRRANLIKEVMLL